MVEGVQQGPVLVRTFFNTTELSFPNSHPSLESFSDNQPQRGSALVDKAQGHGAGILGSIPNVGQWKFLPKFFRRVVPPSHPPISIPSPVHTSRSFFSPSEISPLIPPQNPPQVSPPPLLKGFSVWGHPLTSPLERKPPPKERHSRFCSPRSE